MNGVISKASVNLLILINELEKMTCMWNYSVSNPWV